MELRSSTESQGTVGCTPTIPIPTWAPYGKSCYNPCISGYLWIIIYNPQESLENTINTMGTLLEVHPNRRLRITFRWFGGFFGFSTQLSHRKTKKRHEILVVYGCLIGILIMVYYNPNISGDPNDLYTLNTQVFCFIAQLYSSLDHLHL